MQRGSFLMDQAQTAQQWQGRVFKAKPRIVGLAKAVGLFLSRMKQRLCTKGGKFFYSFFLLIVFIGQTWVTCSCQNNTKFENEIFPCFFLSLLCFSFVVHFQVSSSTSTEPVPLPSNPGKPSGCRMASTLDCMIFRIL